jgi:hypothetical protein
MNNNHYGKLYPTMDLLHGATKSTGAKASHQCTMHIEVFLIPIEKISKYIQAPFTTKTAMEVTQTNHRKYLTI